MNKGILSWLKYTDYEKLKYIIGAKRNVYIWGSYSDGKYVRKVLEEHNINVKGYIDSYKQGDIYDNLPLSKFDYKYSPEQCFIIIAVVGKRKGIENTLKMCGFKKGIDYKYITEETPHIILSKCWGKYEDQYGNLIQIDTDDFNAEIEIKGYGNCINIGKDIKTGKGIQLFLENGSKILIGESMDIENDVSIESKNGGIVNVGNGGRICKSARICSKGGEINIGINTSIGRNFLCLSGNSSYVKIGNDCMFSADTSVLGTNSHSIFNMETKENLSLKETGVYIGNHVWLGKCATVLCDSNISDGCIVGANSLVKTIADCNCLLVGNPARISSTNRLWDRRRDIDFDDL